MHNVRMRTAGWHIDGKGSNNKEQCSDSIRRRHLVGGSESGPGFVRPPVVVFGVRYLHVLVETENPALHELCHRRPHTQLHTHVCIRVKAHTQREREIGLTHSICRCAGAWFHYCIVIFNHKNPKVKFHPRPLDGLLSPHKADSLPPEVTHEVEHNGWVAKFRLAAYFQFCLCCVCVVGVHSTFLESLLLISCLASCSSASFFSACGKKKRRQSLHNNGVCNRPLLLFINSQIWLAIVKCVRGCETVWLL